MKKTIFFALVLTVGLALAGCGKADSMDAPVLSGGSDPAAEGGGMESSGFGQMEE